MAHHKALLKSGFLLPTCEKHFHDHDETWLILKGSGTGFWIDHDGNREDFILEAGDVWMIPAGFEHGSDGTKAPGCHEHAHYCIEQEGYIPSLKLVKTPTDRYGAS